MKSEGLRTYLFKSEVLKDTRPVGILRNKIMLRSLFILFFVLFAGTVQPAAPANTEQANREAGAIAAIVELAEQALEQRLDQTRYRISAEPRWIPGSLAQLPEKAVLDVVPGGKPERYTTFSVRYLEGNRERKSDVQLRLTIETRLPVAAERIPAGTRIGPDHLFEQWVETNRDRDQLVMDAGKLEGKTIRRTLAMGEPVRRSDITTDYLVEAGETVTLVFSGTGMRIDLLAIARQNGAADEDIRVYSEETRRTYLATVRGPGEVVWKRTL